MAKTTYYAWSNFTAEVDEKTGQALRKIGVGEEITQDDLGVGDADWQELIDSKAIRTEPYPENLPPHLSPMEHERAKIVPNRDTVSELMLPPQHESHEDESGGETELEVNGDVQGQEPASVLDKVLGLGSE